MDTVNVQLPSDGAEPALEVRGVCKSFAGVTVLRDVDLVVKPGTVHALVGHNGSGKSTLIKALAGFHAPDVPVVGKTFGRSFTVGDHVSANEVGLRFVHQDLGLVDQLSTVDNLALGVGFPVRSGGTIKWSDAVRRSSAAMKAIGYDIDTKAPVGLLSASERTGVAIARALQGWSGDASVVVLDEPTASMPGPEAERLFEAVELLRRRGIGIVYVSHHLDEILRLADEVTVLRNGRVVMCRPVVGLTHGDLVTAIVGRELAKTMKSHFGGESVVAGKPALVVEDLQTTTVRGVSFTVGSGEIVGLAGIVGSGRDDVVPAIAGAIDRRGTVRVGKHLVPRRRPRAAIRAGLGHVPANRRRAAVLPTFDAASNLTVSGLRRYMSFGLLNRRAEARDASDWIGKLEVSPANPQAPILTLSGGNQQKVMVGRWLRMEPTVLCLDEPTQGVDVGAQQTIYLAVQQAALAGNAVLVSSSDSDELAALCHRVLVFVRGRVVAELTGSDLDPKQIDALSLEEKADA